MLFNRVIGKIVRESSRISIMTRMLTNTGKLPESAEAIASLQKLSPDLGGSCWTDNGFQYEERSLPLSVIVPAYNVEKYIINCLESVLRQQISFPFEVIVVDDGSTDATAQLLESYEQDQRITVIHQQNQGLSAARNTGIACSRGQYLCFVDSDDELPDGALETLLTTALKENAKLVIGSYEKCLRSGTVQYVKALKDEKTEGHSLPGFAHGRIIHCSVLQNLRFPEGYWYEDTIMAQIVYPMCGDATYTVSALCYKYYSNESGISSIAKGNKKSLDSLWIMMRLLKERTLYGLLPTQGAYESFLSSVYLTYHRTKYLGADVARCVFAVQRMLLECYYGDYEVASKHKEARLQRALRANDFRKYILACEFTR